MLFRSDEWMADYGFLRVGGQSVADVLTRKRGALPELVHVHHEETVRDAISLMREYGVSQLPVVRAEPPLSAAEVMGSVSETQLLELAFNDPSSIDRLVGDVAGSPLPTVGSGEEVDVAVEGLERAPAVLVLDSGHPVGILTRSDLLEFLAQRQP